MARRLLHSFLKDKKKNAFLNNYVDFGTISKAAKATGLARQCHYFWLDDDDEYRVAFLKAKEMVADLYEEEAFRRAVEGEKCAVFYKGKKVHEYKRFSDALLTLLLKGAKPDVYRDNVKAEVLDGSNISLNWGEGYANGKDNSSLSSDKDLEGGDTS